MEDSQRLIDQQPTEAEKKLLEMEKTVDEATYEAQFKRTFIQEDEEEEAKDEEVWTLHDMTIP